MQQRTNTDHGFMVEIWKPIAPQLQPGRMYGLTPVLGPAGRAQGITLHNADGTSQDLREELAHLFLPPQRPAGATSMQPGSICDAAFYKKYPGWQPEDGQPHTMTIQARSVYTSPAQLHCADIC